MMFLLQLNHNPPYHSKVHVLLQTISKNYQVYLIKLSSIFDGLSEFLPRMWHSVFTIVLPLFLRIE